MNSHVSIAIESIQQIRARLCLTQQIEYLMDFFGCPTQPKPLTFRIYLDNFEIESMTSM